MICGVVVGTLFWNRKKIKEVINKKRMPKASDLFEFKTIDPEHKNRLEKTYAEIDNEAKETSGRYPWTSEAANKAADELEEIVKKHETSFQDTKKKIDEAKLSDPDDSTITLEDGYIRQEEEENRKKTELSDASKEVSQIMGKYYAPDPNGYDPDEEDEAPGIEYAMPLEVIERHHGNVAELITEEQFFTESPIDHEDMYFYKFDNILCDSDYVKIDDPTTIAGELLKSPLVFTHGLSEVYENGKRVIYIHNWDLDTEYCIKLVDNRHYSDDKVYGQL